MKRKIFAIMLSSLMLLASCGQKDQTEPSNEMVVSSASEPTSSAVSPEEPSVKSNEETTASASEEKSIDDSNSESSNVETETKQESTGFDLTTDEGKAKMAAKRIESLILCYDNLIDKWRNDADFTTLFVARTVSNLEQNDWNYDIEGKEQEMFYSNGNMVNTVYPILNGVCQYFYEYINKDKTIDLQEYFAQFSSEDDLKVVLGTDHSNEFMVSAVDFAATLSFCDEVSFGDVVEDKSYKYFTEYGDESFTSMYKVPVYINGKDYTLVAIFDKDWNLLNVDSEMYDFEERVYTLDVINNHMTH